GTVTFQNERFFFVQDARGGVRAESANTSAARVGDKVEVVGFPGMGGDFQTLTESLVRTVDSSNLPSVEVLDLNRPSTADNRGVLVRIRATFLAQKMRGTDQVLDLQLGQRFYAAVLSSRAGKLPAYEPGSQLDLTGVRSFGRVSAAAEKPEEHNSLESVEILL